MSLEPNTADKTAWGRISRDGLWSNNVVLAQSLALCPLLAVTGTATNGLGMGLATTVACICCLLQFALLRPLSAALAVAPQVIRPAIVSATWNAKSTGSPSVELITRTLQSGPAGGARA